MQSFSHHLPLTYLLLPDLANLHEAELSISSSNIRRLLPREEV